MREFVSNNGQGSFSGERSWREGKAPTVRVEGPAILKDAFESLLAEAGLGCDGATATLLLLVGDDWEGRLRALPEPCRLLPAVLVASGTTDLQTAHDHGIHVYLHEDEPLAELRRAVESAAHGEAYHSPRLLQSVLRTVQRLPASPPTLQMNDAIIRLSPREREIALQAAAGLSNAEIGERLAISGATVRFHLHNVFQKLGIERRGQLVGFVIPLGRPSPEGGRTSQR